jgi:hypothetical protein
MKSKIFLLLGLTLTVGTATEATAQGFGVIWSSVASGCVADKPNLASIDAAHGTVAFGNRQSGVMKLSCPVTSAAQPDGGVLTLSFTFYNDHGFDGGVNHCTILTSLLRTNLNNLEGGADIVDVATPNGATTGRQTRTSSAVAPLMDFGTSYYWVYIQLSRDSPTATCNPVIVGVNLTATLE